MKATRDDGNGSQRYANATRVGKGRWPTHAMHYELCGEFTLWVVTTSRPQFRVKVEPQ